MNVNDTCAIISMMKHEHDFINQWIEYHIKIGFSHFYLLIDNLTDKQSDYIIEDNFKGTVTLIDCNPKILHKHWGDSVDKFRKAEHHESYFMQYLLNVELIESNIITEHWVTAIGIDQFIYLNGNTIQEYIKTIDESCTQVIMPWSICAFNNKNICYDNLMENVHLYSGHYNGTKGHSNGLIRTSNLRKISGDSHHFISKCPEQKVYIIDEYFTMPANLQTQKIFEICHTKLQKIPLNMLTISSFHIMLRNVNEAFVKEFAYWGKNNMDSMINNISNNTIDYHGRLSLLRWLGTMPVLNIISPKLAIMNKRTHYEYILEKLLEKHNISLDRFYKWVTNTILI